MERRSHYNKQLKPLARALRKYGTLGEAILWTQVLRAKNFYGLQFNRQFPIDRFIVDFVCRRLKLVIEIDGSSHDHKSEQDKERDLRLNELGYTVIRISESDVRRDLNNVIRTLVSYLPEEILNDDEI